MNNRFIFTVNSLDDEALCAQRFTEFLEKRKLAVSCAESATCGLVAKLLTDRAGSSAWYWGGAETYANDAKKKILGVPSQILDDVSVGPVSLQCAAAMADGMRALSDTDLALSVTGIAGPSGAEPGKPVGTVCFGFSSSFRKTETIRVLVKASSRDEYRRKFASACLTLALAYAKGEALIDIASRWV